MLFLKPIQYCSCVWCCGLTDRKLALIENQDKIICKKKRKAGVKSCHQQSIDA